MSARDFSAEVLEATARRLERRPLRIVVTCPVCQATAWRPVSVNASASPGGDHMIGLHPLGFKPFLPGDVCEHPVGDLDILLDTMPEAP